MLKMLTLIIDRRIREGAKDAGIIPVTQNGFQDGLRANDNVFVLLCLINKVQSLNKPLYAAYLDLKHAFPGTDRSSLWVLATMGISGPMIEWLKILYDRIRYLVRLDGRFAPAFRSLLGILTGDTSSPHLWTYSCRTLYSPVAPAISTSMVSPFQPRTRRRHSICFGNTPQPYFAFSAFKSGMGTVWISRSN